MAPSTSNDHYIGFRVSLTSKSAIRYIGTLCSIDTKLSTVALKDVRSFGTEGRLRDGGPVMPSECIYPYIIFRASDILDLQVLSKPQAPTISSPPSSTLPSTLLSDAPLTFPSASTPESISNSQKDSTNVSNISTRTSSYLSATQPSAQLAPSAIDNLSMSTPWTYDGFDGFDLGLAKPFSAQSSGAATSLPKTSKFSPLYPPTTAMLLPPYGQDGRQKEPDLSGRVAVPSIDPYQATSPFDLSLSQGFANFRQFPLGGLSSGSAAASNSERVGLSSNSSNHMDTAKFNTSRLQNDSPKEEPQENPNADAANVQPDPQCSTPDCNAGPATKSESSIKTNPSESSETVKAPVPRAWGPPPVAIVQGQLGGKSGSSRSGNNIRQDDAGGSTVMKDQALNVTPARAAVSNVSGRGRDGVGDRARRGGRRGRWGYGSRRGEGRLIEVPNEDFNFEEMHEKLAAIQQEGNEYPPVDPRYDKSKSFFDNLVSEKDVRAETSVSQQRAKDVETFGEAGAKAHSRRRGASRNGHHPYRGRPARARARGRGR